MDRLSLDRRLGHARNLMWLLEFIETDWRNILTDVESYTVVGIGTEIGTLLGIIRSDRTVPKVS